MAEQADRLLAVLRNTGVIPTGSIRWAACCRPLTRRAQRSREPTTYRRNAARTASAVELKYPGGSMKPHSLKAEPLVRARR